VERLLQGAPQPIFLVPDRHPVHKSRSVKQYLVTTKSRLQMFFLPAYSPELHPDEQVWNDVKDHAAGRTALRDNQHLRADSGRRRKGFRGERENDSGVKANRIPG